MMQSLMILSLRDEGFGEKLLVASEESDHVTPELGERHLREI